jgi:hypothetical protein
MLFLFFFLFIFVRDLTSAFGLGVAAVITYFFQVHAAVRAKPRLYIFISAGGTYIIRFWHQNHDLSL